MMEFWKRVLIDTILFIALAGLFAGTGMFYITSAWIAPLASFVLAMLQLTSMLVGSANFHFSSFGSAMLIAIIMAIFNAVITSHEDRL